MVGDSGANPKTDFPDGVLSNDGNGGLLDAPEFFEGYNVFYNLPFDYSTDRERPFRHSGGANYLFNDTHAKYMKAEVLYPHPAPPTKISRSSAPVGLKGQTRCIYGNWFVFEQGERQSYADLALNTYGYSCTLD